MDLFFQFNLVFLKNVGKTYRSKIYMFKEKFMLNEAEEQLSEQDLSEGELVDQDPLEEVEDPPVRLAGYNQIPDFGEDTKGTLHESNEQAADE